MSLLYEKDFPGARKKIFLALGGINAKVYSKPKCLEITLYYLSSILGKIKNNNNLEDKNKKVLNELQKDLLSLSNIRKVKKNDFQMLCQNILKKYKI